MTRRAKLGASPAFLEPAQPDESDDESHPPQLVETGDEYTGDENED